MVMVICRILFINWDYSSLDYDEIGLDLQYAEGEERSIQNKFNSTLLFGVWDNSESDPAEREKFEGFHVIEYEAPKGFEVLVGLGKLHMYGYYGDSQEFVQTWVNGEWTYFDDSSSDPSDLTSRQEMIDKINNHRASLYQRPLNPQDWSDEDLSVECKRLGL